MALTTRNNGDPGTPAVVNDFKDLLTGVMADQLVTIKNLFQVKSRSAAPGAPSGSVTSGGSVDAGAHDYAVTYVDAGGGETLSGTHLTLTTAGGNLTGSLTAIPTGPTGATKRNIYRSKVGTSTPLFLVHTINDNSTTTYADTTADSGLPATQPPTHPSFGGSTQWLDNTGAVKAQIFSDGAVSFDAGKSVSDGTGQWTFTPAGDNQQTVNAIYASTPSAQHYLVRGIITGDSTGRVGLVIRSDGYGSLRLGNNTNSRNLFATSGGVTLDSALAITGALTGVTTLATSGAITSNSGKPVYYVEPNGTTAGIKIYIGTSTPGSPQEGDIWIKA